MSSLFASGKGCVCIFVLPLPTFALRQVGAVGKTDLQDNTFPRFGSGGFFKKAKPPGAKYFRDQDAEQEQSCKTSESQRLRAIFAVSEVAGRAKADGWWFPRHILYSAEETERYFEQQGWRKQRWTRRSRAAAKVFEMQLHQACFEGLPSPGQGHHLPHM